MSSVSDNNRRRPSTADRAEEEVDGEYRYVEGAVGEVAKDGETEFIGQDVLRPTNSCFDELCPSVNPCAGALCPLESQSVAGHLGQQILLTDIGATATEIKAEAMEAEADIRPCPAPPALGSNQLTSSGHGLRQSCQSDVLMRILRM